VSTSQGRTDIIYDSGHLVQLSGADIWTVGEAKVQQTPFTEKVQFRERSIVVGCQSERTADVCPTILTGFTLSFCK
jgi:hypothetical protein